MAMNEEQDPDLRNFQPPCKKAKGSKRPSEGRFKAPTTNEEIAMISKGYVPRNTQKNTDCYTSYVFTRISCVFTWISCIFPWLVVLFTKYSRGSAFESMASHGINCNKMLPCML